MSASAPQTDKKLINDTRLVEPLTEECNGGGIGNGIHHAQSNKDLEGAPVVDLEFKFFITEVEQLLQHQHLEENERIKPQPASIALASFALTMFQQWPEGFPRDRLGQSR